MNLHNEIMNIPVKHQRVDFLDQVCYLMYKEGHRDARHAGAELSLKYESLLEDYQELTKGCGSSEMRKAVRNATPDIPGDILDYVLTVALESLTKTINERNK